ncbi:MAG: phenylalanine--tRNA ligase subunit beta [bacterium]
MKISYNWLIELTGLNWSAAELSKRLTDCGTAVEDSEATDRYMDKVVVGEVIDLKPIEGADKIRLATVNTGSETMDLVCGAPNVAKGQKVAVALLGASLAGSIVIKKVKIRGVESCGMICSERELGISEDHSGIIVLPEDATIGQPLAEYLDYKDTQLTFELTPNRPDSMSAIGIARDAAALASVKVKKPEIKLSEASDEASKYISVRIDDPDACPRYAARIIKNVKIAPSPWWVKKKLLICGIRPINNVVDITNLVLLESGHPLHAFDYDRFSSKEVVVRRAMDKEKFTTLDGKEHTCTNNVLLITNGKEGVAAGGVMGGLNSEVEDDTKNILLEAAYFNPSVIRKSRKHLGFVTESSSRFEKGADPNEGLIYALNRAAALMAELCDGEVLKGIVDCYPSIIEQKKITLRLSRCHALIGKELSKDRIIQILSDLELSVKDNGDSLDVIAPTFRPDLEREIDLIEEVARIEGWNNIPDAITNIGSLFTPLYDEDKFVEESRKVLTSAGFDEIVCHGLVDSRFAEKINPGSELVKIINPSSSDLNVMRNNLVMSALPVISHNMSHRNMDLKLFELGKAYFPPDKNGEWVEDNRLLLVVTGNSHNNWREKPRELDFYDLTGAIDSLSKHFHWSEFEYSPINIGYFEDNLSYEIRFKGTAIGSIGQVKASLAKDQDIKQPLFLAELSTKLLIENSSRVVDFKPLPQFPAAPRDLAIVVDAGIPAGDLLASVKKTAGDLAEKVEIFDLYTGKQIESGKKSIAISISYRHTERSLSGEEIDERQEKIINSLKEKYNAEIRDK